MRQWNGIRVFIVDNHVLVRSGLRLLIADQDDLMVVDECPVSAEIIQRVRLRRPDVMLLDGDDEGSLRLITDVLEVGSTRIIMLLREEHDPVCLSAIRKGIHGVVLKSQAPTLLLKSIRKVHEGELWFNRRLMAKALSQLNEPDASRSAADPDYYELSGREREVITLLGKGLGNNEIAARLHLSPSTIQYHLTSIYKKLDVSDRFELFIFACRHGIIELSA